MGQVPVANKLCCYHLVLVYDIALICEAVTVKLHFARSSAFYVIFCVVSTNYVEMEKL